MYTRDKKRTHISRDERLKIEGYVHAKIPMKKIAEYLGRDYSAITREIKRGKCTLLNYVGEYIEGYSAEIAQRDHDEKAKMKGAPLKIGHDLKLANYLEDMMLNKKYSPAAALAAARESGFATTFAPTTIYRYIYHNIFCDMTHKTMIEGRRSKPKADDNKPPNIKNAMRESIEQRAAEIDTRETFGHWEMDSVVGERDGVSTSLLVLTERKTRAEIIIKIATRTAAEVVKAVDGLHRKYGRKFEQIFKTITVDNGGEFSSCEELERGGRTKIFYCHPFSSWERGSNERANRIIRRFVPKGVNIGKYSKREVQQIQDWINNYPRKLLGWKCASTLFFEELDILFNAA